MKVTIMGDSVINHIAGARVPRVADVTFPPACIVQRHESTLKPRQRTPSLRIERAFTSYTLLSFIAIP